MNEADLTHRPTSVQVERRQRLASRAQAHDNHSPRLATRAKQHEGGAGSVAPQDTSPVPLGPGPTTLTDAMSDLVVTCDANGFVTYMNPALRAFLQHDIASHLPPERHPEAYGTYHPDGTLFAPDDLPLQTTRSTGEPQHNVEMLLRRPDGTERLVIWDAQPLRDSTGALLGAMAVGHDVTDDYALAQAREDWLATAAHDLRSPTTAILGNVQLARRTAARLARALADGKPDEVEDEHEQLVKAHIARLTRNLELVEARTHDLLRYMSTLLDASASVGGTLTLFPAPDGIELRAVVQTAVEHIRQVTSRHRVVTHLPEAPVLVDGDEVRLRQVMDNLLSNALKYSPDGGQITVSLKLDDAPPRHRPTSAAEASESAERWATVCVAAAGMGIPPGDIEHIFERYRRASGPASKVRGTGIGLYASRAIVEAHGGHIWVERTATPSSDAPPVPVAEEGDTCSGREPSAQWHGTVIAFAIPLRASPQHDEAGDSSRRPEAAPGE